MSFSKLAQVWAIVTILIKLISNANTLGIKIDPAWQHPAKNSAANLRVSNIQFINADAREGDYVAGTVFFLYTLIMERCCWKCSIS